MNRAGAYRDDWKASPAYKTATPSPRKRTSTIDEDDLLLEDAIPAKKARSGDELFEEEELDEDALLGLSDNDDHYEGGGDHPELDEDGGYEVYPPTADEALGGGEQEFGGQGDDYQEEGYHEEATSYEGGEGAEESYGGTEEGAGEEDSYHEPTLEVSAGADSSLFEDVLDIDITDDSLIRELEEDSGTPGGTFVKPSAPPPRYSTPKAASPVTKKPMTAVKPQPSTQPSPERPEIRAPDTKAEAADDEEEEEKEGRGDRFKSERKEMVSLKSSRNRNIPDTLVLSEKGKKELAEYERQQMEEKQKKMQRRQRGRGGRGNRGGPWGGRGGPGMRFPGDGRGGFMNNNMGGRMMPPFGHPRFGGAPPFRQRGPHFQQQGPRFRQQGPHFRQRSPQRGFREPFIRPVPVVIPPLRHQPPPLITLTDSDFTEDHIDESFENAPTAHPPQGFRPQQQQQQPPQQQQKPNVPRSEHRPGIHVNPHFKGQRSEVVAQMAHTVTSTHLQGHPVPSLLATPRVVVSGSHRGPGNHQQWQEVPQAWQAEHHQGPPPVSQAWSSQQHSQQSYHEPIYAQCSMGGAHTTSAVPPHQHFEPHPRPHHPSEPPRVPAVLHQGGPEHHAGFHHAEYHQRHNNNNNMELFNQSQPPHEQQHPPPHLSNNQQQQGFMIPRHMNPPPSEHFGGPRPTRPPYPQQGSNNQNQRNQQSHWQRNTGPRHPGPQGAPSIPVKKPRLAPPPQAIIEEAAKHQQESQEGAGEPEQPDTGATTSEESDPETKKLRLQIEEQKKLREAIMRRKEQRRQQLAAKRQLELKKRLAAKDLTGQSEQSTGGGDLNIQQQQPQGGVNKQKSPQNKQGPQKQQVSSSSRGRGGKTLVQRGRGAQQRRNSAGSGQPGHPQQHPSQEPSGHPIPTLGGGPNQSQIHQLSGRRLFHRGGGPQNMPAAGRGHMQQHQPQGHSQGHPQRGGMASRHPARGQPRGRGRGQRGNMKVQQRGAMNQGGGQPPLQMPGGVVQIVHHPLPIPGLMQVVHPGALQIIPQAQPPPGHLHPYQQPLPHMQNVPQHQPNQRGRGQPRGKGSIKDRLGRGRGSGPKQQGQRGGMQGQRGGIHQRGRGGQHHQGAGLQPHPGGGDAPPMLNPQGGVSVEGLAPKTDGNEIMKMMVSIGPVQALKMYPQHRKAIGFFFNPIDAINFHQTFNGSDVDFVKVNVKLIQGRQGT